MRVLASAQIVRFKSEIVLEDYNLMDIFPAWLEASLGTLEEKIAKFADPERRPALKEAIDDDGRRLRRGAVSARRDHGELDLAATRRMRCS